jgi:hypothetical protein
MNWRHKITAYNLERKILGFFFWDGMQGTGCRRGMPVFAVPFPSAFDDLRRPELRPN